VLLRHGETEWSRLGKHTGLTDVPLTAEGRRQAETAGHAIRGMDFGLVLCSPRIRARQTAEAAGCAGALLIADELAEWDYGAYEGLTTEQILDRRGRPWSLWRDGVPAGTGPASSPGESAAQVRRRCIAVLDRVRPELLRGRNVLMVAHGHIIRAIAAAWVELPETAGEIFSLATGTISQLGFDHDRPTIIQWNCPPDA